MGFFGKMLIGASRFLSNGATRCERYAARYGGVIQDTAKTAQKTAQTPANVPNMFDTIKCTL